MLSQHDKQALADIEERLCRSDPELAHHLEQFDEPGPHRHRRVSPCLLIGLIGLTVSVILLVVALVEANADALVLGVMALLTNASWWMSWAAVAWVRSRAEVRNGRVRRPPA